MANPSTSRPAARPGRRSLLRPPALPLRLEPLEPREVPSTSIPLTGEGWRGIGPNPIVANPTNPGDVTVAPNNQSTGGRVSAVAIDPGDLNDASDDAAVRNIYYAATSDGGIARSFDGGVSWAVEREVAPDDPGTVVDDTKKVYSFLTDNLPASTPVTVDGVPRSVAQGGPTLIDTDRNLRFGAIAVHPRNRNVLFAGGGNSNFSSLYAHAGSGLWISKDALATVPTWRLEKGPNGVFEGASFQKIMFVRDPIAGTEHVFVVLNRGRTYGTNFSNAVYRSDNEGTTWTDITAELVNTPGPNPVSPTITISDFSVDPTNPRVAYVSVGEPGGYEYNGVYRTQEALGPIGGIGLTNNIDFVNIFGGNSVQIPGSTLGYIRAEAVPQNPSTVYILATNATSVGGGLLELYRSRNAGVDLVRVANIPADFFPGGAAMGLLIDPTTGASRTRLYVYGSNGIRAVDINETQTLPIAAVADISRELPTAPQGDGVYPVVFNLRFDRAIEPVGGGSGLPIGHPLTQFQDTRLVASTEVGVYRLNTVVPNLLTTGLPQLDWQAVNGGSPLTADAAARGLGAVNTFEGGLPVLDDDRFVAGTFRTGSPRFQDVGGATPPPDAQLYNWPNVAVNGLAPIADTGNVIWDYRDTGINSQDFNTVYQAFVSGQPRVRKSTDGGLTWADFSGGLAGAWGQTVANPTPAFELDPSQPFNGSGNENIRLLYGTDMIYENITTDTGAAVGSWVQYATKTQAGGNQFVRTLPFVTGLEPNRTFITNIGVGRFDRNTLYASVNNRRNSSNTADRGPGLYRIWGERPGGDDPGPIPPTWRDVTPWIDPTTSTPAQTAFDAGTANGSSKVGFRMAPYPGGVTEPYPNVLGGSSIPFQITDIAVDPNDSNIVYLTLDHDTLTTALTPDPNTRDDLTGLYQPYGTAGEVFGRVLRTTDGGLHWEDISYQRGFPNYRTYSVVLDPNRLNGQTGDDVYIATEVGVWKLTDPTSPTSTWVRVGAESVDDFDGMPDVMVRDLDINTTTGVLSAATFGRGVWQFPIRPYVSGFAFTDANANGILDYTDANGNGVQDPTEPLESGRGGVPVTVFDIIPAPTPPSLGEQVASNVSRTDGFFVFRSLPNSDYNLRVLDGSELVYDTFRPLQITTPLITETVTNFPTATTTNGLRIGVIPRAGVSGVKFNDVNGNGLRDAGEPTLPGWTIELRRGDNNSLLATTVTDANGFYAFSGLGVVPGGAGFRLVELQQAGWVPTGQEASAGQPADGDPTDGIRTIIPDGTGAAITVNFGNFRFINISGMKFEDLNGNGLYDNEPALAGFTIVLTNVNNPAQQFSAITDANGRYFFGSLGAGVYRLREVQQPGFGQSTVLPPDITGVSGGPDPFIFFGNFRNATVTGFLFEDENGNGVQDGAEAAGLPNIAVGLFDAANPTVAVQTVLTNAGGVYTFTNTQATRPNTVYRVRVTDPAVHQTEVDETFALTASGAPVTVGPLAGFRRTTVSGLAFEDTNGNGVREAGEPPLVGSQVTLANANNPAQVLGTATTNGFGQYTFFGVPSGIIFGQPVPPLRVTSSAGFTQTTPPGAPVVLTSGDGGLYADIGVFRTALITGRKFNDVNGNGVFEATEPVMAGWTIQLVNSAGAVVQTSVTNAAGYYTFATGPGTFTVQEVAQAGWVQTTAAPAAIAVNSGVTYADRDFGNFQRYTIAGIVFHDLNGNGAREAAEPVQSGWTVQLLDSSGAIIAGAVTGASGGYVFGSIGPGAFTVREVVQPGWFANTPNPVVVAGVSGTAQTVNFGNFFGATVTGTVYEDLNRNTVREASEPASAGWTVQIVNAANVVVGTTTTDASGTYSVAGLPAGTYTARLVPRAEYTQTTANPLPTAPGSGQTVTLSPPIGVLRLGSVSGQVFLDTNRNGIREAFERALPGVAVSLFRDGILLATQTPAADGSYQFLSLDAGNYTVRAAVAEGFTTTVPAGGEYNLTLTVGSTSASPDATGLNFGIIGRRRYAVAADGGGGPRVQVYDAQSGVKLQDSFVYEISFTGGVRVATGDVTGDGVDDLATVAGKGGGPRVRVLDGLTGETVYDFFSYEEAFRDGLYVALGDVNGDGFADMITGTDAGGGPRVTVYSGKDGSNLADYFAYDQNFRGGVRIGAGDTNGDGRAEVITAPGIGGGAQVIVWSGLPLTPIGSFVAFGDGYAGGVFVSGGGLRPDGRSEVVVGSGQPTAGYPGTRVRVYDPTNFGLIRDVNPYPTLPGDSPVTSEVRVTAIDRNGDNVADVGVSLGAGVPPLVKFLDGRNGRQLGDTFLAFEATFLGGVFIG